jgi:small-conductance mechanosensitive channel
MSNALETLKREMHETKQNAQETWLHVRLSKMADALDALLSEHRAEVERLKTALGARRTKMDAIARDAALDEAKTAIQDEGASLRRQGERIGPDYLAAATKVVERLKSRPAERYLPESEVRKVLCDLRPGDDLLHAKYAQGVRDALLQVADVLGVDLDAAQENE